MRVFLFNLLFRHTARLKLERESEECRMKKKINQDENRAHAIRHKKDNKRLITCYEQRVPVAIFIVIYDRQSFKDISPFCTPYATHLHCNAICFPIIKWTEKWKENQELNVGGYCLSFSSVLFCLSYVLFICQMLVFFTQFSIKFVFFSFPFLWKSSDDARHTSLIIHFMLDLRKKKSNTNN